MPNSSDETTAQAVLSEAAAIAKATSVIDQQKHHTDQARMDTLLKAIDLLVVAGLVNARQDLYWLLPPCGFDVCLVLPKRGTNG